MPSSRSRRRCPQCGSKSIATILYGYPAFSEGLERDLKEGRVVLGGCENSIGGPRWQCNTCRHEWTDIDFTGLPKRLPDSPP